MTGGFLPYKYLCKKIDITYTHAGTYPQHLRICEMRAHYYMIPVHSLSDRGNLQLHDNE